MCFDEFLESVTESTDDEMTLAAIVDTLQFAAGKSDDELERMARKAYELYGAKPIVFHFHKLG